MKKIFKQALPLIISLVVVIALVFGCHWLFQLHFYWSNVWTWFIFAALALLGYVFGAIVKSVTYHENTIPLWFYGGATVIAVLFMIVFGIANSDIVYGKQYYETVSKMVTVIEDSENESAFPNLLGENNDTSNLPLIGIPEAMKIAETEMARFPALGSQFELLEEDMTSQSINGELKYVIPLQPRSMFKWDAEVGNTGYFIIDRNNRDCEFVETSLMTTTQAPFGSAAMRIINNYLSEVGISGLATDISPEVDEDGLFHYVATVYELNGPMSAFPIVKGIVELDAVSLTCKYYNLAETPEYVDRVFPEWVFADYLYYYGSLKNGIWNSLFAEKDVLIQTNDMDVIYVDGTCWYYTGMTTVGKDNSSNGIIMMNSRTGELKYHVTHGISEARAQEVVEGLVQEKGYVASYPLLLQVGGVETYFMLMRDASENLVGYSFVAYGDYTKAAVATTLQEAQTAYLNALKAVDKSEILDESKLTEVSGIISDFTSEVIDGNTYYYLKLEGNSTIYQVQSSVNIQVVFAKVGDTVKVKYFNSGSDMESVVGLSFG